jgi:membrane-associated phospholipid phosphatase
MSEHAYTARAISTRPLTGRARRPGPLAALGVAGLCLIGLVITWVAADLLPAVQLRDTAILRDFEQLSRPHVDVVANGLLQLLEPGLFTCWGIVLVAVALVRRRPRVALAVALVMALAPFSSEALKPLLAHPHLQVLGASHIGAASWPSGHSTAALALVLCAVLVAPVQLRPLITGLGAAFTLAVGCSLLILAWHMPSDVIGGYLIAALWMALAVAGLRAAERLRPAARGARGRSGALPASVGVVRARFPQ